MRSRAALVVDAAIAETLAQSAMMWKIRETLSPAEKAHGKALKHDVSVPVSRVAEFMERGGALVKQMAPDADLIAFGHVGDGNIHFNVTRAAGRATRKPISRARERRSRRRSTT